MLAYRREIDGLRCLAVMSVVLAHAGFSFFAGGYVGVDVFFVISGYLITSIVLREIDAGSYSLSGFYERRARRILPALTVVVLSSIPFALLWMMPLQLESFSKSVAATFGFVSNFYFREQVNYFAPAAELQPLLHTWSLAVEEQFYLFMPFLLLLYRRFGAKRLLWAILFVSVLSFIVANRGAIRHPDKNFFEFKSRIWELMIGSLLALIQLKHSLEFVSSRTASMLSAGGLLAIFVAVIHFDEKTPMPGLWALLPTLGAACFIAFASNNNVAGKLMSTRLPVAIGLISYSIYLWHFPVFALARIRFNYQSGDIVPAVFMIALVLLLSYLSYRYVEKPCRRVSIQRRTVFWLVGLTILLMMLLSLAGVQSKGFPQRLNPAQLNRLNSVYAIQNAAEVHGRECVFNSSYLDSSVTERILACAEKYGKGVIIIGDSHGEDMFGAIATNSPRRFIVGITKPKCRPQEPKPYCQYDAVKDFVNAHADKIEFLIYNQAGQHFLVNETELPVRTSDITTTISYLQTLANKVHIIWIGSYAEPRVDLKNINFLFNDITNADARSETMPIYVVDKIISNMLKNTQIEYISAVDAIQYSFENDFFADGRYTYADKDHWSAWGEEYYGRRLLTNSALKDRLQ